MIGAANAEEQKAKDVNQDPKIQELVAKLNKLTPCQTTDPEVKATCTALCTGAGTLWGESYCNTQEHWDLCRSKCQSKDILDCTTAATKLGLTGQPKCN